MLTRSRTSDTASAIRLRPAAGGGRGRAAAGQRELSRRRRRHRRAVPGERVPAEQAAQRDRFGLRLVTGGQREGDPADGIPVRLGIAIPDGLRRLLHQDADGRSGGAPQHLRAEAGIAAGRGLAARGTAQSHRDDDRGQRRSAGRPSGQRPGGDLRRLLGLAGGAQRGGRGKQGAAESLVDLSGPRRQLGAAVTLEDADDDRVGPGVTGGCFAGQESRRHSSDASACANLAVPVRPGRQARAVRSAGQRFSLIVAKSGWRKLNRVIRLPMAGRSLGTYTSGVGLGRLSSL